MKEWVEHRECLGVGCSDCDQGLVYWTYYQPNEFWKDGDIYERE